MILQRKDNGNQINFDNVDFVLQEFNPSAIEGIRSTSKTLGQNGRTSNSVTLDSRQIDIIGTIIASGKQDMDTKKSLLNSIVNPLFLVDVIKDGKVISSSPSSTPEYARDYKLSNDNIQQFAISLFCESPFWQNQNQEPDVLASWIPDFCFPAVFIEGEVSAWGHREPRQIVELENTGFSDIGMLIEFEALAKVVNPSLLNVITREEIRIKQTINPGEKIIINTQFGEKAVHKISDGVKTNIFTSIDEDANRFLQLHPGQNVYKYDATTGLDYLNVTIHRFDLYVDEVG